MIRDDLDSIFADGQRLYAFSLGQILVALAAWMLLIGVACMLVFRWTSTPPETQPYAPPIRSVPNGGPTT